MQQVFLIELNEINFDFVREYGRRGRLPNLNKMIDAYGVSETTSEENYDELEPWIQWVTAHTGLTLAEHGVFRLGDIVDRDIPQIWERLEAKGLKVGAVSPMNAKNRTRDACFFIPDPWTRTPVTGSPILRRMYDAIAQAVNDNADAKITPGSAFWLAVGLASYARPANYGAYLKYILAARRKPWSRALVLDQLLADVFVRLSRKKRPHFASLFLNAGAHIQHHYMFSSEVYQGTMRNPDWYINPDHDPLLEVYELYDRIISQIGKSTPDIRLMIATGLHQTSHEDLTFYWRLRNHADFLNRIGAPFASVEPRMSRDFLVSCSSAAEALRCEGVLASVRAAADGLELFEIDNRGAELFVSLTYPHEISEGFDYCVGNMVFENQRQAVAFVAVKNGAHHGIGYFLDTGGKVPARFPLSDLPDVIERALCSEFKSAA